jgi:hypothetical protein
MTILKGLIGRMLNDPCELALQRIEEKDAEILKWGESLQIINVDQQRKVEELLTALIYAEKRATEELDRLLSPHREIIKATTTEFAPHFAKLRAVKVRARELLGTWRKTQLAVTEGAVLERASNYWEQRKAAEKTGELIPLPDLNVTVLEKTSHHNMGSTNYRPHVKVRIVNPNAIPREYCVPTESLLRKAGELALAQNKPMPSVEGAVIEVEYIPVSRLAR